MQTPRSWVSPTATADSPMITVLAGSQSSPLDDHGCAGSGRWHDKSENPSPADQTSRLVIEWTSDLRQAIKSTPPTKASGKESTCNKPLGVRDAHASARTAPAARNHARPAPRRNTSALTNPTATSHAKEGAPCGRTVVPVMPPGVLDGPVTQTCRAWESGRR
jgi:hypothetical protein